MRREVSGGGADLVGDNLLRGTLLGFCDEVWLWDGIERVVVVWGEMRSDILVCWVACGKR